MHPGDVSTLKNFVEHYSLCQDVYEILIVSEDDTTATDVQFVYEHTHSKVNFADAKDIKISTKGINFRYNEISKFLLYIHYQYM